jgi:DNA replication protein DnaC
VLIVDDFGLKSLSQFQADDIAEIVSERYLRGGMVFTRNRRIEEWQALFPDPVFANSVLDRLAHNAHQLVIEGESYRKKKRPETE